MPFLHSLALRLLRRSCIFYPLLLLFFLASDGCYRLLIAPSMLSSDLSYELRVVGTPPKKSAHLPNPCLRAAGNRLGFKNQLIKNPYAGESVYRLNRFANIRIFLFLIGEIIRAPAALVLLIWNGEGMR